jgi:hypothetical protein
MFLCRKPKANRVKAKEKEKRQKGIRKKAGRQEDISNK